MILYGAYVRLQMLASVALIGQVVMVLVVSELDDPNFSFAPGTDYGKAYREWFTVI